MSVLNDYAMWSGGSGNGSKKIERIIPTRNYEGSIEVKCSEDGKINLAIKAYHITADGKFVCSKIIDCSGFCDITETLLARIGNKLTLPGIDCDKFVFNLPNGYTLLEVIPPPDYYVNLGNRFTFKMACAKDSVAPGEPVHHDPTKDRTT